MNAQRETRFALVLNGGVSLAVWMGGVTHELNRLRLASAGASPPERPAEAAVQKAWRDVLAAADRTAVVDTVAGTSAGGVNGTLIAAAIAGGKDLPDMRSTWSDLAALRPGQLLREPPKRPGRGTQPMNSMLDGTFFHDQLENLIGRLAGDGAVTESQDCTLLVTATALDAPAVPIHLEGEAHGAMVDSRRVFRFERRTDDERRVKDDFADRRECLALASRASASFPVAFEPVGETEELHRCLISPSGAERTPFLIDGGVLDNAPFGPLMDVLRQRPVGAPFDRVLLYVTPSPGVSGPAKALEERPSAARILGRVVSATREPDQRLDYEGLRDAFRRMGYTVSAPHDAVVRLLRSPDPAAYIETSQAVLAADQWFRTYRFSRAEAVEHWLGSFDSGVRFALPEPTELHPDDLHPVPTRLAYTEDQWRWGLATAERLLRWWGRALVAYSRDRGDLGGAMQHAFGEVDRAQRRIARLEEQLEAHLRTDVPTTATARAHRLNDFYTPAMDADIRGAVHAAAQAIARLPMLEDVDAASLIDFTLAVEVASAVLAWSTNSEADEPTFRYRQITPAARPILSVGEVTGKDDWLERKLYGQRWAHFGAFASDEGRCADWLWGRLDGASALCDYLLESVDPDEARPLKEELARAILAAEDSSEDLLRAAVAEADGTTGASLLRHMSRPERQSAARLLWRQAVTLAADTSPGAARAQHVARAFADPTWKAKDLRKAPLRTRALARSARIYGWPVRGMVRRRVERLLDL
jgi:predicted acylesterase/phospholipase RssA